MFSSSDVEKTSFIKKMKGFQETNRKKQFDDTLYVSLI